MNAFLSQLTQWPPTSTTVTGASIIAGLGSYFVTGSWQVAAGVVGVAHILFPQSTAAAVEAGITEAETIVKDIHV